MTTPPAPDADLRAALARIADALGLPIDAFVDDTAVPSALGDAAVLVRAFDAVRDPAARARCLAFILAEARRAGFEG